MLEVKKGMKMLKGGKLRTLFRINGNRGILGLSNLKDQKSNE